MAILNKNKVEECGIPDIKCYKTSVMKTVWYWQ